MLVRQLAGRSPLSAKDFSLRWPSHLSGKFATLVVSVHSFTLFLFDLLTMELAKSSTFKFSQVPSTFFFARNDCVSVVPQCRSKGTKSRCAQSHPNPPLVRADGLPVSISRHSHIQLPVVETNPPPPSFPLSLTRVIIWCFLHRLSTTLPAVPLSGNGRSDSNLVFVQITAHTCV